MKTKKTLSVGALLIFYLAHQDFWNWRTAEPVVFRLFPIGLFYHACYTLAAAALMWLLVRLAWPAHLEEEVEHPKHTSSR
jgi:hypothetical protein